MIAANVPQRFPIPFANAAGGAYIRSVPTASQIGIEDGAASLTDGFPPDTFIPVSAGGVPPFGEDFNGLLNQITAWCRWQAAGGPVAYNSAFSTAVGGYPLGAVLKSTVAGLFWISTAENNTVDPDAGPSADWTAAVLQRATVAQIKAGTSDTTVITPKGLRDSMTTVFGVNGSRIHPDGYIEQWGYSPTFPTLSELSFDIMFQFPFPNVTINFFAIVINALSGHNGDTTLQEISLSLDRATVFAQSDTASSNDRSGYRWRATGY